MHPQSCLSFQQTSLFHQLLRLRPFLNWTRWASSPLPAPNPQKAARNTKPAESTKPTADLRMSDLLTLNEKKLKMSSFFLFYKHNENFTEYLMHNIPEVCGYIKRLFSTRGIFAFWITVQFWVKFWLYVCKLTPKLLHMIVLIIVAK